MKAAIQLNHKSVYLLVALWLGVIFSTFPTQAQTFTGQFGLTPTPASLRVVITSLPHSPVVRLRFENQDNYPVQVQIQDRRKTVLFDELRQARYAGEFDLSSLPAGVYTIHLQTPTAQYQQAVRVDLLGGRYPVVTTDLPKHTDYVTAQTQPAASQPINSL